jgi:hypothetical protein
VSSAGAAPPVRVDFIVGMARSGTTWLGRTLSAHPELAVFGESSFFGRLYVRPRPDGTYGNEELKRVAAIQREQDWCATTGDESGCLTNTRTEDYPALIDSALGGLQAPVSPADAFRSLASAIALSEGKPRVVEKTPHHVHWLDRIAASFPEARIVLVTRGPYGFMLSLRHLGDRIERRHRRALDRPFRHPLLCALAWRGYMLSVERALERYRDRILLVDSNSLRERPGDALALIQSFLGVELHELAPALAENSSFRDGRRPALEGQDVFWMNVVAGRVMSRHGYARERVPLRPARILSSLLMVPVSLAFVVFGLRRQVPGSFRAYLWRWLGHGV